MDIETVLDGLATRLATITGLRVYSTVPDRIEPPAAIVGLSSILFDDDQSGSDVIEAEILLAVTAAQGVSNAQTALYAYLDDSGTSSVRTALYGDTTLSGAAAYARLVSADAPRTVNLAGTDYVGVALTVEIVS